MAPECAPSALSAATVVEAVTIVPNPIGVSTTVVLHLDGTFTLKIVDVLGREVLSSRLTQQNTSLDTRNLHQGIYFYKVTSEGKTIQSGKLVSNQ